MKVAQKSFLRMKNILKQDKERISLPLLNMIKSDMYNVLNNYLDIYPEDLNVNYIINNDGYYDFEIKIKANRIKKINFLNV